MQNTPLERYDQELSKSVELDSVAQGIYLSMSHTALPPIKFHESQSNISKEEFGRR